MEQEDLRKEGVFHIKLTDFDGKIVKELRLTEPLQFAYLFWKKRLFVTSRDSSSVLLERSYSVLTDTVNEQDLGKH